MNYKKNVYVSGTILAPLKEGHRAAIVRGGDIIYTSRVVEIFNTSPDSVCFETMNSVYHVSLEPVPFRTALPSNLARCA